MLIYGQKSTQLTTKALDDITCESCGATGTTDLTIYTLYFHLFWIPTFPFSKSGYSHCRNCQLTLEKGDMPLSIETTYEELKKESKSPLWSFAGILVFTALAALVFVMAERSKETDMKYLANPKKCDAYGIKTENNFYSSLWVTDISQDSIYVIQNSSRTENKSGISMIHRKENYNSEPYSIAKASLQELYETGVIISVIR